MTQPGQLSFGPWFIACLLWLVTSLPISAGTGVTMSDTRKDSHVALVIGIRAYDQLPDLGNAAADARAVAARLSALGYRVIALQDATGQDILRGLAGLRLAARDASQVVIYLAGHGLQSGGAAYFLAADAPARTADMAPGKALPLGIFATAISDQPRQKIIFFDACRDLPLTGLPPHPQKPSYGSMPAGLLIAFAAGPGAPSYDGAGLHSPFTAAVLHELEQPDHPLEEILRRVRLRVVQSTQGQQIPWIRSSLLRPAWLKGQFERHGHVSAHH